MLEKLKTENIKLEIKWERFANDIFFKANWWKMTRAEVLFVLILKKFVLAIVTNTVWNFAPHINVTVPNPLYLK